eukprot:8358701-Ditylum_brightwellii.AAC.1
MMDWYHEILKHLGHLRLYATTKQWYNWPRMKKETEEFVKTCKVCQENKITTSKKYRKVPVKDYKDPDPFEIVHLDSVGSWTIRVNIGNKIIQVKIRALSMCDTASSWVKFAQLEGNSSYEAAIQFDSHWLCQYPQPRAC